ncbi:MAG: DUF4394 domain-containing protein [Pyrinomonadaceae bacterium]
MKGKFSRHSFIAVPFLLGLFFFAGLMNVKAVTIYGITDSNQLVRFDSAAPNNAVNIGSITGLQAGENILGIDFRPANGQLYALGSSSRLYTINLNTGAATLASTLSVAINGTSFGVDFNPVIDRLRVTSDTDQNLRINVDTGAVLVDGTLMPVGGGTPPDPTIGASAYSNNFAGTTTTTLYDIDYFRDRLVIQNPANDGILTRVGELSPTANPPVGNDVTNQFVGFDIGAGNIAYASFTTTGATSSTLNTINLQTGLATLVGAVGGNKILRGIAVAFGSGTAGATNVLDFTGDRRADYVVFRPSNNFWYINPSSSTSNLAFFGVQFGDAATDILTPGDYDGDGRTDIAVWRRPTGTFFVLRSSDNVVVARQFGQNGDEPVARDYDNDGRTDYAVVRRAGGLMTWFILNSGSNNSFRAEQFGADTDVVAPGDYDGDGRFDLAVFRGVGDQPATFFVRRSSGGDVSRQFGVGSDLVVPGDYDGDGRTDYAVVRTGSAYFWFILRSSDNSVQTVQLGAKPDLTTQNDYDGDGRTDVSVYRQQTSTFFVIRSLDGGVVTRTFGQNGDYPVANYDTH